ncbi:hypothetical protein ACFWPQ_25790 [Streptomyces sp. NPDC058464]|uniref:hypothetical protein n=1 Tax=Streptomyces sp. NPDC058464 TaxID=3346511 RepID=UPI0036531829
MRSADGGEPREPFAGLGEGGRGLLLPPGQEGQHVDAGQLGGDRVAAYEVVADPARLRGLELAVLDVPVAASPSVPSP